VLIIGRVNVATRFMPVARIATKRRRTAIDSRKIHEQLGQVPAYFAMPLHI